MRIRRLELKNFRTFSHAVFEDLSDMIVLVSPNGRGKSSVLEAIAGMHDLVSPYHRDDYEFRQTWQKKHVAYWPNHLPEPIKYGEYRAEISIDVEATGREIEFLRAADITSPTGTAKFVIEDGRYVSQQTADATITRLFQYHNPRDGVGFVDYVRPIRFYPASTIGNFADQLTDSRIRQSISEFHRPFQEHNKFGSLKGYIVGSQLGDLSYQHDKKEPRDSLELFKAVFNRFFFPKRFIGYSTPPSGDEPRVIVESPFGQHDIDALSDGEKEMVHVLAHLYRFRDLHNVVLWDTPELQLNAALECRLSEAIRTIAPNNQFWIATHSLEFIDTVALENVFSIRQDGNSAVIERASGEKRKARVAIYREMGAKVGLQLVSSVVAFLEGRDSNSDKAVLDRLLAPELTGVNFVAGGSCENILAVGTRANDLLAQATTNGDFLAILDRDYRSDSQVDDIVKKYGGRVFMWNCHELENVILDPKVVLATLDILGQLKAGETEDSVLERLRQCAVELSEWIAGDWMAWEIERTVQFPSRRIGGKNPKASVLAYAARLMTTMGETLTESKLEEQFRTKLDEVRRLLGTKNWIIRLPGKQILERFVQDLAGVDVLAFRNLAVGCIIERRIPIPEMERLKETISKCSGTM